MKKLTPNLIVETIEPLLPFYLETLGFTKTVEVPLENGTEIGFVILVAESCELMLQSRASVALDVPPIAEGAHRSTLYLEVDKIDDWRERLAAIPKVIPERTTAYGAREIIVRDPAGNTLFFASH